MVSENAALSGKEDVVIRVGLQISDVKSAFRDTRNRIGQFRQTLQDKIGQFKVMPNRAKGEMAAFTQQAKKFAKEINLPMEGLMKQGGINKKAFTTALKERFNALGTTAKRLNLQEKLQLAPLQTQLDKASFSTKKFKNEINRAKIPFAGWAMSVMFFGMALKRMFSTVWKSSTKTFQDVMHSTKGTVTEFDKLDGSMRYLQFTAGAALEPIAKFIFPIIDAVSTWISTNEELFRKIMLGLGIGGTVLLAIGTSKLALDGLAGMFSKLFSTNLANTRLIQGLGGLKGIIRGAVGLVAIGFALEMTADAVTDFKDGKWLSGGLKLAGATFTTAGGYMLMGGKAAGGAFLAIGVALDLIGKGTFFETLMRTFGLINNIVEAAVQVMTEKAWNAMANTKLGRLLMMEVQPQSDFMTLLEAGYTKDIEAGKQMDQRFNDFIARAEGRLSTVNIENLELKIDENTSFMDVMNSIQANT